MIEKLITIPTQKEVSRDDSVGWWVLGFGVFFQVNDFYFLTALNLLAY